MKKLITLILLVLCAATLFAQAPEKFSYQAVVRNTTNQLVTNAPVGVRVSILQGSADGTALYVETHTAVTNANGLLTVEIGGGKAEQGAFDRIDWANGPYFLKTETDPNGGGDYSITSVQQLLSVPYALYAKEAANSFSGDYNDLKNKPVIPQVPSDVSAFNNDAGYITLNDIPTSSKSDETNDAGVVQTTACGEIDLCDMASQLARLQAQFARQQAQMEETQNALLSTVDDSEPCPGTPTVKDIDGNVYNTVKIGEQCWMRENLRTTRYADGSPIPAGGSACSFTEPYYYDYPSSGFPLEKRGYLYNWSAVMHGEAASDANPSNVQGICPDGWHLPSTSEWTQLTDYVRSVPNYVCDINNDEYGGSSINKALSATEGWNMLWHWSEINIQCYADVDQEMNNATGFSAIPIGAVGGMEHSGSIGFVSACCLGEMAFFWSSSKQSFPWGSGEKYPISFWLEEFWTGFNGEDRLGEGGDVGFSVRCLRGSATVEETSVTVPSVTTSEVSDVSDVTAVCGGEVIADGGVEVTERGVCWGTEPNPTVEGSHTSDGTGTGEFVITLTDLVPNTNYYVRAYATNSVGTVYGEVMSFTTAEEQQQDTCTIVSLPYSEDFESYTTSTTAATGVEPACWELVHEDAAMTDANRPQLYYNSNFAHSGSYSLKLYNRGIYAMPALSEDVELNQVKLDMYLRQANARYQLQVGIWEEDGTFVPVATFNNSTTEVEHVTCDFSSYIGSGRRVAFRNTLGSGGSLNYSTNYLDDIVLSVNGGAVVDEKSCSGTPTLTDVDGNTYSTVQIGDQCWMRENLRTTHYADGTAIPAGGDNWSETDRYYYVNPDVDASVYGYYYNWPAAMHGASSSSANPSGVQGVCPAGWHLPSDAEWTQLTDYVGSQSEYTCGGSSRNIAKALASTEGWYECDSDDDCNCDDCAIGVNSSTNNASGFSVVPAGKWEYGFNNAGYGAYFWFSTEDELYSYGAYGRDLYYYAPGVDWGYYNKGYGFSVRCLRDETGGGSTSQTLPAVTTGNVSDVTLNSAVCGGEVTADGGAEVTERGVCWSTETNPTVDVSHTSDGTGTGSFTSSITGLTAGTTYYVRAYATNSVGTAYGEEVTFTTAEEQQDTCTIVSLPYSEDFESYTTSTTAATGVEPACWELVQEDVAMTDANRPQLYYNSNFAHSGSYSLKLYNRGIYAMPALSEDVELNNVKLEMYLRQANARYQLQVGIWEEDGTFVPVATFNNSTTEVEHVTCDFSSYMGSGRRIAFRNTLGSGSNLNYSTNYLDDIVLSANGGAVVDEKSCPGTPTVTDHEGNVYATVQIGDQCWMRENMRTTHRADGTAISAGGDNVSNTELYYYDYSSHSIPLEIRGYLYNWPAAMAICPMGWHLPSDAEWTQLLNIAGDIKPLASAEGWMDYEYYEEDLEDHSCEVSYNQFANNATGFSAFPVSHCYGASFGYEGDDASFWGTTTNVAIYSFMCVEFVTYHLNNGNVYAYGYGFDENELGLSYEDFGNEKVLGLSVRCLRDETGGGSTSQTLPAVITGNVSDVTLNSVVCGGEVTADGGAEVTERGVCWGTEPNPTVEGSHTSDGTGTGEFVITLTDLVPNTNYYVRAYATNSVGTAYGEEVSFTTMVSQQDTCTIVSLPYSEDFESYTTSTTTATGVEPACWELVQEDVAMTDANRPQLYYNSNFAHSGNYSLKLSNRGIYAMPALSEDVELNNVQLDMYLRQANARYQLQVGIWEEDGTFVPVATFNNSTTEVEHVTCDFSSYIGSGRRVAFRNTLGSGGNLNYSTNYLDDIVLSANGGAVGDAQPCPGAETVTDYDGNVYNTVKIGEQCWMRENLRTMHYEDGTAIPAGGDNLSETDPYYYVNSDVDASVYGYYYNWPAAMHGASSSSANPSGVQGICPTGWHLPSDAEWTQLTDYVGGQSEYTCGGSSSNIAKALASETGWNSHSGTCAVGNDQTSNNASGFGAVPAGFYWLDGFDGAGYAADFWSSTEGEDGSSDAYYRDLGYLDPHVLWNGNNEYYGFSVRCLRDETGGGSTSQTLPAVTTGNVSDVTLNSAVCGGEVTADGGAEVTERGVCWSTEPNPTVDGSHTSDGAGTGAFSSSITGLTAGTTYYVRAYATNSVGTVYGEELSFTTAEEQQDTCTIVSLPYSEDFESYTTSTTAATGVEPTCWELVHEDAAMTEANRPQLYYNSNFAHSGSYSLKLYNRGIYAMPALPEDVELNNVQLDMYLRQANARYQLQVGIWEEDGTFVPVATFNNSTTEVEHVSCDFSSYMGSGRRVAFRNTLGSGSNLNYSTNYLDDIVLNVIGDAVVDEKSCPGTPTLTDVDGNTYSTVQIGEQCWMRENLRVMVGTDATEQGESSSTVPYYYVNPNVDIATYGFLYNWSAAMQACPSGWHLPSDAEWTIFSDYVRGQNEYVCHIDNDAFIAKALASQEGWHDNYSIEYESWYHDCCAGTYPSENNATGFSVFPAGWWYDGFDQVSFSANFWFSQEDGLNYAGFYDLFFDVVEPNMYYEYDIADLWQNPERIAFSVRCLRDETGGGSTSQTLPAVTTGNVSDVTLNSAVCGGEVTADGGAEVTERGVCWSTEPNPTVDGDHTSNGSGIGTFIVSITDLEQGTTYYVRAYATSNEGIAYGEEVSFTTRTPGIPIVDEKSCPGAETITDYDSNTYSTVKIGEQCWMRENLRTTHYEDGEALTNYYGNNNVAIYGYIYTRRVVMRGNASSYSNPSHLQGICPTGWHVPSSSEWTQLFDYVGSVPDYLCGGSNINIAKALASTEGWMDDYNDCTVGNNQSANNTSGFAAVPAIYHYEDIPHVRFVSSSANGEYFDCFIINYNDSDVKWESEYESGQPVSVRCLRDVGYPFSFVTTIPTSNVTLTSADCGGEVAADNGAEIIERGVCWNTEPSPTVGSNHTSSGSGTGTFTIQLTDLFPNTTYYVRAYATNSMGTSYGEEEIFTTLSPDIPTGDSQPCPGNETVTDYDGNVYNTVKIGEQCWMRENLRTTHYADGEEMYYDYHFNYPDYDYDVNNVAIYGILYHWPAVMHSEMSSNANPSGVQGVCPNGWHVPSNAEWAQLFEYMGSVPAYVCGGNSSYIAKSLASQNWWLTTSPNAHAPGNNLTTNNASGFGAIPAGCGGDAYFNFGSTALYWSATGSYNYYSIMCDGSEVVMNTGGCGNDEYFSYSVRCLRDETGGGSTSQTLPAVTTGNVSDVTLNSAVCGGEVTADGGAEVTERGVCWSTEPNPTVEDSHTSDGAGTGAFSSSITGLTANTTYYVRAYATNSVGTAYGEELSFTTALTIPEGDAQPCPGAETVTDYDSNVYNTVKIGEQCWMRENLRTTHYSDGGELTNEWEGDYWWNYNNNVYGNDVATYGYVYFWPAVMHGALSSFSNPSHVQGICPTGWHVPSSAEWTQLFDYIGSVPAYRCGGNSSNIAKALASTEGWMDDDNDCTVGNNQGANNASGFSAVPAGHDYDGGMGSVAGFWSTSKGHYCIDVPILTYNNFEVYRECNFECYQAPAIWSSVRCLRDEGYPFSAVTTAPVSNVTLTSADCGGEITTDNGAEVTERGVCWSTEPSPTVGDSHTSAGNGMGTFNIQLADLIPNTTYYVRAYAINSMGTSYGEEVIFMTLSQSIPAGDAQPCPGAATVTDYDGNVYNTVKIGEQCWMKENLKTTHFSDGEVVSGITAPIYNNVATYGYLYMWYDVMHNATSSDANPSGVQGVCPNGWHVPSDAEYTQLVTYVGSVPAYVCGGNSNYIAKALASQNGWLTTSSISYAIGNNLMANNASGFGAVPAGYVDDAAAYELGFSVGFWTSSIGEGDWGAYYYGLSVEGTDVNRGVGSIEWDYRSVRCLRDETGGGSTSQTLPAVTTGNVSDVTFNSAVCGGEVTADGGAEVTERGVCWSTETNPTVEDSHTSDGAGTGAFSSSITGLTANTTYYVRAYATNSVGTVYGEVMSFTTAEEQQDTCTIVSLPYSEDFESYTTSTTAATGVEPDCWELVQEDVAMTDANRPQLYYNSNFAHSGSYSLKLYNRGIYAMPALSEDVELNNVQLDMYLRQANARYQLQVGIWEEDGTFVPVATFNNSTTEVEHVTCDFSSYIGSGRRVAFRNTLGSGGSLNYSTNYLDDIVLSVNGGAVVDEKSCSGTPTVTDHEGNVYATVQIGNQCWMRENLRTTHYADGTAIPAGGNNTSETDPYYYVKPDVDASVYGYYYNWPAAMMACPTGWHLPSDAEWTQLTDYVGSQSEYTCGGNASYIAKALASTEEWVECDSDEGCDDCAIGVNSSTNNASGFSVVPVGDWYGVFSGTGNYAYFWSSTEDVTNNAWTRGLDYVFAYVYRDYYYRSSGFSVRCLRD